MTDPAVARPSAPLFPLPRTVVLVGLMGAGKTSVGRRLAARLGLPFRDADHEIEAAAGCTVEEYFARYGEPAFRVGERKVIARLISEMPVHILATGGGAFMDERTRQLIRQHALSVWLRADLEQLLARTARRANRPLLKQGNPREILEQLMQIRYPVYAEAELVINSADGPPEDTVDRLQAVLERRYGAGSHREVAPAGVPPAGSSAAGSSHDSNRATG